MYNRNDALAFGQRKAAANIILADTKAEPGVDRAIRLALTRGSGSWPIFPNRRVSVAGYELHSSTHVVDVCGDPEPPGVE